MSEPAESLKPENIQNIPTKFDTAISIACKLLLVITGLAIGCVIGFIVALFLGLIEFAC